MCDAPLSCFGWHGPEIPVDGEMQAYTAVVPDLLKSRRSDGPLARAVNVLVFPNPTAVNAS